jgi:hypothetical protein
VSRVHFPPEKEPFQTALFAGGSARRGPLFPPSAAAGKTNRDSSNRNARRQGNRQDTDFRFIRIHPFYSGLAKRSQGLIIFVIVIV